jgi:hypothetical protein
LSPTLLEDRELEKLQYLVSMRLLLLKLKNISFLKAVLSYFFCFTVTNNTHDLFSSENLEFLLLILVCTEFLFLSFCYHPLHFFRAMMDHSFLRPNKMQKQKEIGKSIVVSAFC